MALEGAQVSLRRLAEADLPLLHDWLNRDHVARWYDVGGVRYPSFEQVEARYLQTIRGERSTLCYIALYDGRPAGFVQWYLVHDYPDYAAAVGVPPGTAGIDIYIGEEEFLHRGLGPLVLQCLIGDEIFARPDVRLCIIGPDPENKPAIRAYEKAGFRYVKSVDVPGGDPPVEYQMWLERGDLPLA